MSCGRHFGRPGVCILDRLAWGYSEFLVERGAGAVVERIASAAFPWAARAFISSA